MKKISFLLMSLVAVFTLTGCDSIIGGMNEMFSETSQNSDARTIEAYAKALEIEYYTQKTNGKNVELSSITYDNEFFDDYRIQCENKSVGKNLILTNCTVNGRGYYSYENGRAIKIK